MDCLEVKINGERVCTVGRADVDNYHVNVVKWRSKEGIEVSAAGATGIRDGVSETFSWGSQFIVPGDVVVIRVLANGVPDDPIKINVHDHKQGMEELEHKIVESMARQRLKAELEGKSSVFPEDEPNNEYCSFCGLAKNEVTRMFAGPSVLICDECVDVCFRIMSGENPRDSEPRWPNSEY